MRQIGPSIEGVRTDTQGRNPNKIGRGREEMSNDYAPFKEVRTKIVGVTMGEDAETRQLAIRTIGEHWDGEARYFLDLVPQPDNPFDADAIRVMAEVPGMGRVQLGFVSNSACLCGFCGKDYPSWPKVKGEKVTQCPVCSSDQLRPDGLATKISQLMREQPNENYYGEILSITGGTEDKPTSGCNFAIKRAYKRKS